MKILDVSGGGSSLECSLKVLGDNKAVPKDSPPLSYYIAFTLSSYPQYQVTKSRQFHELSPAEQKEYYYKLLKDYYHKNHKKYGMTKMMIHYELDKSQKIHVHGYVDVKESVYKYDILKLDFQSHCHKYIGKKGNRKDVCTNVKWIPLEQEEFNKWFNYCNKENILKPSKIISHNITTYI